jgi:ribosomal protein S18 acetylase RimI-like enzyme
MIRPSIHADAEQLIELTAATGLFRAEEIATLRDVLDAYFDGESATHACFTSEGDGRINGFVYIGPTEMAHGNWYVWWIAVDPSVQGKGLGRQLLRFAEEEARRRGGRVMFIETSGQLHYEPTRRFYLKNGYDREAVLRDFYLEGDDLVVFRKRLIADPGGWHDP